MGGWGLKFCYEALQKKQWWVGFILCINYVTSTLLKLFSFSVVYYFFPLDIIYVTGVWNYPDWNDSDIPVDTQPERT